MWCPKSAIGCPKDTRTPLWLKAWSLQHVKGSLNAKSLYFHNTERFPHFMSYSRDGIFSTAPACIWRQTRDVITHNAGFNFYYHILAKRVSNAFNLSKSCFFCACYQGCKHAGVSIQVRGERAFTLAKKTVKNRRSSKKPHFGGGFFAVFRGSCLATSNENPECEKNSGFFMPV